MPISSRLGSRSGPGRCAGARQRPAAAVSVGSCRATTRPATSTTTETIAIASAGATSSEARPEPMRLPPMMPSDQQPCDGVHDQLPGLPSRPSRPDIEPQIRQAKWRRRPASAPQKARPGWAPAPAGTWRGNRARSRSGAPARPDAADQRPGKGQGDSVPHGRPSSASASPAAPSPRASCTSGCAAARTRRQAAAGRNSMVRAGEEGQK